MDLIDLIFRLVRAHVPMTQEDFGRLFTEASDWKMQANSEHENIMLRYYAIIHRPWIVRLAIAVAYIPLTRMITQWTTKPDTETEL